MKKHIIAVTVFLLLLLLALFAGNEALGPAGAIKALTGSGSEMERVIFFQIRLPRILAAACAGAAFSVSGYLLQNNLNNVIASPGLLGINNGAGLFVLLSAVIFPYHSGAKCMMAFLGALLASAIVSGLSIVTGLSKTSVILSGVAISSLCASASQLILSIRPETVTDKAAFSIGGFASVPLSAIRFAVPVILCCLVVSVSASGCLDIMLLGDEVAAGLGLHIVFYRTLHMILASVLAGAAVSMCGLVGFVGLMVPNFIKLFFHGKARDGMLLCIFVGASLLLLCDTAARLVVFPYEIPCGLILSVLGTPFLIWILVKRRKRLVSYD